MRISDWSSDVCSSDLPVVEHAVDVVVIDAAGDVHVELGIDVQRLGCPALVFENADAGIQRQSGKDDAACRHDEYLEGRTGIVRRAEPVATIRWMRLCGALHCHTEYNRHAAIRRSDSGRRPGRG